MNYKSDISVSIYDSIILGAKRTSNDSVALLNVKRLFDLLISFLSCVVLMPVFILISLCIKVTSKGSIFFLQDRMGKNGEIFQIIKFRTMYTGSEKRLSNAYFRKMFLKKFKIENDQRVTPFGKFLRRTCLDELPQIFNVVKGDMSIVGPRPILVQEKKCLHSNARFTVLPGMTGLWQIKGKNSLSYSQKRKLDYFYITHYSFPFDLKIIFLTIPAILNGKGFNY